MAKECVYVPQHLGAQELDGVMAQIVTNTELGKRPLPILPLINQTSDDLATLVLARDTHGSFFGVVSRLPCKKKECIVPLDFDATLTICETCRCYLHRGCVCVTMVERNFAQPDLYDESRQANVLLLALCKDCHLAVQALLTVRKPDGTSSYIHGVKMVFRIKW